MHLPLDVLVSGCTPGHLTLVRGLSHFEKVSHLGCDALDARLFQRSPTWHTAPVLLAQFTTVSTCAHVKITNYTCILASGPSGAKPTHVRTNRDERLRTEGGKPIMFLRVV